MITKQTILKSAGFEGQHSLYITLSMQLTEDGNVISTSAPHRTCIDGGRDIDRFLSVINEQIVSHFGYPPISEPDIAKIKSIYAMVPTAPLIEEEDTNSGQN